MLIDYWPALAVAGGLAVVVLRRWAAVALLDRFSAVVAGEGGRPDRERAEQIVLAAGALLLLAGAGAWPR